MSAIPKTLYAQRQAVRSLPQQCPLEEALGLGLDKMEKREHIRHPPNIEREARLRLSIANEERRSNGRRGPLRQQTLNHGGASC